MDQKQAFSSSDVGSYNQGAPAYSARGEPSAPSLPAIEYQSIRMPSNTNEGRFFIRKRGSNNRHFPINAALFLIGLFLFPPVWLISIFWKSDDKYERAWRKVNIASTIILVSVLMIMGLLLLIVSEMNRYDDNKDPSWEIPSLEYPSFFVFLMNFYYGRAVLF